MVSLFQKNLEELKKSINYFNNLSEDRKAYVVANIVPSKLKPEELENLSVLLIAVRTDISNYDETKIANVLFELGMDETYAKLLVNSIIKQIPTLEYQINLLSRIDEEKLTDKISFLFNEVWIENKEFSKIEKKHDITSQELEALVDVLRTFMNTYLRSEQSEQQVSELCKTNGMTDKMVEALLNVVKTRSEYWRKMLNFSNSQDSFFILKNLETQNNEILRILREMLNIFKKSSSGSQSHYQ